MGAVADPSRDPILRLGNLAQSNKTDECFEPIEGQKRVAGK